MNISTAVRNFFQKKTLIKYLLILSVFIFVSFSLAFFKADAQNGGIVQNNVGPIYTYDFSSETVGQSPLNTTAVAGTFEVANHGVLGKSMRAITVNSLNLAGVLMNNFSLTTNYSVIWKQAYNSTGGRDGFILRSQNAASAVAGAKQGYYFNVNDSGAGTAPNTARIYYYGPSTITVLQSTTLNSATPRWFKATVNGSTLSFFYSDDGVNYTQIGTDVTDTRYPSGVSVQYIINGPPGNDYVDDVSQTLFTTVQDTTPPVISLIASTTASTTANITWNTDENANSKVSYGTVSGVYPNNVSSQTFSLPHSINLTGLAASTLYYYVVVSSDSSGNTSTSTQKTLMTAPASAGTISVSSPKPFQVIQRNTTNQANIVISGTYTGSPSSIEASWNNGAYAPIVSNPSGGTFTGTLFNKIAGQGTLSVRFVNNTGISTFVSNIGIGDIYVIAGQSNASGRGFTNNVYSHPTLKATIFGNNDVWQNLTDPTDSSLGQIDAASDDQAKPAGSAYPLIATYFLADQSVPIAFIPASFGGSAIGSWARDLSPTTLYGSMYRRINAVGGSIKGVLWFQGESDADHGIGATATEANYLESLITLGNNIYSDFGAKLISGQIAYSGAPPHVDYIDDIRQAQIDAWNQNGNVLPGPAFPDVNLSDEGGDTIHFKSDNDMNVFASRWWASIKTDYYGGTDGRGPRLVSANWGNNASQIVLTFMDETLPIFQISNIGGFKVQDSLGLKTILSSNRTAANQITITLTSQAVGATTVSLATTNTGIGVNMPTDSSPLHLPAEIFENRAVVDATNPTVSITSPATGSTVSGPAVSVAANAADNFGVVGVQFKLDGVNLGSEDLVSPYSISWDVTAVPNGLHTLTAIGRDPSGNTGTSTNVSVTVNNITQPVDNLILDPGFENSTSMWSRPIFEFHSGASSLPMVVSDTIKRSSWQSVNVTAGLSYDTSGWIKTSGVGAGANIKVVWLNATGLTAEPALPSNIVGTNIVGTVTGTQPWTQVDSVYTAPVGAIAARIYLETGVDPDGLGVAWFDDVVFGSI